MPSSTFGGQPHLSHAAADAADVLRLLTFWTRPVLALFRLEKTVAVGAAGS